MLYEEKNLSQYSECIVSEYIRHFLENEAIPDDANKEFKTANRARSKH